MNVSRIFVGLIRGIIRHYALAAAVDAILDHIQLLPGIVRHEIRKLSQVPIPREEESMCHWRHGLVQEPHAIRLHGVQVHDRRAAIRGSAPGGTRKQLDAAREQAQPRPVLSSAAATPALSSSEAQVRVQGPGPVLEAVEEVEAVAADPAYAVGGDAVSGGVALGAGEGRGVDLDGDDEVPVAGAREGDGVAAGAGEEVDDDARGRGAAAGALEALVVELGGYGAGMGVRLAGETERERLATYSAMGSAVTPNQASSVM